MNLRARRHRCDDADENTEFYIVQIPLFIVGYAFLSIQKQIAFENQILPMFSVRLPG